ncbi:MAG: FtsX-like permease family protein [Candidatus Bathyarchaeia archaeon]
MSKIAFPLKDLARRRFQTRLTITSLTICTAATVFLTIFGENLGFEVAFITGGKLSIGFSNIFSRFVGVGGFLNLLAGALITSFLVFIMMSKRMQDIGVMKATGCVTGTAFSYFMTELSIVVLISCIAGTVLGILANFACIHVLNTLGLSISQKPLNLNAISLVFLAFVLCSHISGAWPVIKAIKAKPAEALSSLYVFGMTSQLGKPVLSKLGFTFKMVYRGLVRRRFATIQAVICLATVLTLTTLSVAGGIIAKQTTQSYVERAISKDIVLISHPHISTQYMNFLSQFFETKETEHLNYSDSKYLIPQHIVSVLDDITGVVKVDARFVLEATAYEVQGVIIDPETLREHNQSYYIPVGDHRSSETLILSVEPEHVINEWLIFGRALNGTDIHSALIGDSLALEIFDNVQTQEIKVFDQNFRIAGVCLDPLNNGNVVYIPLKTLSPQEQPHYNLLLLKIEPSLRSQVITEIENKISGTQLELFELNGILEKHLDFLNLIWSSVMLLPLLSLVTATLCLLSYMMLSIAGQQREFGVMRALGTKPKGILKIVLAQAFIIVLISGTIGVLIGLIITFAFLIPEPIITLYSILTVAAWLLFTLGILGLSSLYPAVKVIKKSVADIMAQP